MSMHRLRVGASALVVGLLLAPIPSAAAVNNTWTRVAAGTTGGISGAAPAASGWVVVRDNKAAGQNRIALLGANGKLTLLSWPGSAPQDLESLAAVPGATGQYVAVTSKGLAHLIAVGGSAVTVQRTFQLPKVSNNVEGFALTRIGSTTVALWATRGSTTAAAQIRAATLDLSTATFGAISNAPVRVPYPTANLRQVSDLMVSGGRVVVSSASDPGANGPFDSAVYDVGSVSLTPKKAVLTLATPRSLGTFSGHKIEGIACSGGNGIVGSDDEKQGGWVRAASICG